MICFASTAHHAHHALELDGAALIPSWERPDRADTIAAAIGDTHRIAEPGELDRAGVEAVHDADYVEFLAAAWHEWLAAGETTPAAMSNCWPVRRMTDAPIPRSIRGRLGYYSFGADCSFVAGTWAAVASSAASAQAATSAVLGGERVAFALCRPPGHHATLDQFGGYCYVNNAAVAAQQLIDAGSGRVAVIDVDYHHGNGTQDIFYARDDVFFVSLHADPATDFPYFAGYADETGTGAGTGCNRNLPLPMGTGIDTWLTALDEGIDAATRGGLDALVVSLGVDTFAGDPISEFTLASADYPTIGARLAAIGVPTVIVMEGGYAVAELGVNVAGVLDGFDAA